MATRGSGPGDARTRTADAWASGADRGARSDTKRSNSRRGHPHAATSPAPPLSRLPAAVTTRTPAGALVVEHEKEMLRSPLMTRLSPVVTPWQHLPSPGNGTGWATGRTCRPVRPSRTGSYTQPERASLQVKACPAAGGAESSARLDQARTNVCSTTTLFTLDSHMCSNGEHASRYPHRRVTARCCPADARATSGISGSHLTWRTGSRVLWHDPLHHQSVLGGNCPPARRPIPVTNFVSHSERARRPRGRLREGYYRTALAQ
jgi:hypothetical protein